MHGHFWVQLLKSVPFVIYSVLALNDDSMLIVVTIMGSSVDSMVLISLELAESKVVADLVDSWVCVCVFVGSGDVSVTVNSIEVDELVAVDLILVAKLIVTELLVVGESIVVEVTVLEQLVVTDSDAEDTSLVGDDTDKVKLFWVYKIKNWSTVISD